ncbi:carbamoyltransferase [Gammaproteobacteria bacterium]
MSSVRAPYILGLNDSHDGSACLLQGERILVAIKEERLTRHKHQRLTVGSTLCGSIIYCLDAVDISIEQIDLVVVCAQGHSRSPKRDIGRNRLLASLAANGKVRWLPHHAAHAISAYALSGFEEAAVLVVDSIGSHVSDLWPSEIQVARGPKTGSFETSSGYMARGTSLEPIHKTLTHTNACDPMNGPGLFRFGSLGRMYEAVSKLTFSSGKECGKVMGLAPLGLPTHSPTAFFNIDGDDLHFHPTVPDLHSTVAPWPAEQERHRNLACSAQGALEAGLLHLALDLRARTGARHLCFAGGTALNGVANEKLLRDAGFDDIFIPPAADDSGCAIGAAYWGLWQLGGQHPAQRLRADSLGRHYDADSVVDAAARTPGVALLPHASASREAVARMLDGQYIGWFSGGSEFGPRALGQRSILCDPRGAHRKDELNARIKQRESFRPFAPAILREHAREWFELAQDNDDSPFMLRVSPVKTEKRPLVPAVVHVDGSGRLQTVDAEGNPAFHALVAEFYRRTGVPLVLNTSFNGKNEPIVETPKHALACMLATGLDAVIFQEHVAIPLR